MVIPMILAIPKTFQELHLVLQILADPSTPLAWRDSEISVVVLKFLSIDVSRKYFNRKNFQTKFFQPKSSGQVKSNAPDSNC